MSYAATRRPNPRLTAYAAHPMADINVTPLIDVMLVLLMVFMLAAPILAHQIPLDLPQPVKDQPPQLHPVLKLMLHADGSLSYDGVPIVTAALEPQLRLALGKDHDTVISVDAELSARYEAFAQVLATVHAAGACHIGLERIPSR